MATATPLGPPEPQTAQKQYAGSLDVDAQPSAARISLPGARRGRSPSRCVELAFRTPPRHRAPGPGTWKDPDPRRRSSRGSEGSEQACLPGNGGYATPAGCPVSTTSRRYGLRRTCRLVTGRSHRPRSTWPTRPGYRSPQSGTAINRHVVLGSSNFRSPNISGCRSRCPRPHKYADDPLLASSRQPYDASLICPGGGRSFAFQKKELPGPKQARCVQCADSGAIRNDRAVKTNLTWPLRFRSCHDAIHALPWLVLVLGERA